MIDKALDEKILSVIRKNFDGYISSDELANTLDVSISIISEHIKAMRDEGYDIEFLPSLGYRLISVPDKLYPEMVRCGLEKCRFASEVYYYQSTDSTNDVAERLAVNSDKEGIVVIAEKQGRGRGRLGRSWMSSENIGIWMSIVIRPKIDYMNACWITPAASVAVATAIREVTGLSALIKWPNDVMIDGRKVSGILVETGKGNNQLPFMILGIGVNVNHKLNDFPSEIQDRSISLALAGGRNFSRLDLVQEILRNLEKYFNILEEAGPDTIVSEWEKLSVTFGRRIKVQIPAGILEGFGNGIGENGEILIRKDDGRIEGVFSGDVIIE